MTYSAITAGEVDADSPIDTTLMGKVKDNFIDHESRIVTALAGAVTNGDSHDHISGDGAAITTNAIADANVTVAKLKLTQGSWSGVITTGAESIVAMNRYGHCPVVGGSNQAEVYWGFEKNPVSSVTGVNTGALRTVGFNTAGSDRTGHITWDYHAA